MPSKIYKRYWAATLTAETHWIHHKPDGISYILGQLEEGESTGYRHWQLYFECDRARSLSWCKHRFPTEVHLEPTRSSAYTGYCQKESTSIRGTLFELGRKRNLINTKENWEEIRGLAKMGNFDSIPPQVCVRYFGNLQRIHSYYQSAKGTPKTVKVYWGATETGKTRRALYESNLLANSDSEKIFFKNARTKWWDSYRGHPFVIIDEFDGESISIDYFLRWFDRYPVQGEIKGGVVPLDFTHCWITSNIEPANWFIHAPVEHKRALQRRITVTHFLNEWKPPQE